MSLFNFKKENLSDKIGRVRRCPRCGIAVPSSKVVCPECGWEFDDNSDGGLSAMQRLTAELKKTNGFFKIKEECDVIRTFIIPKGKNDLLELILFFKAHANWKIDGDCYVEKYDEAIQKAKQFYSSDPEFTSLIKEFDEKQAIEKNKKIIKKCAIIICVIFGICLLGLCIGKISSNHEKKIKTERKVEKKQYTIDEAIVLNDETKIMEAIKAARKVEDPLNTIKVLIASNYLDAAMYFYEHKTSHRDNHEMVWDNSGFTADATSMIYSALINDERFDEAWNYHALEYQTQAYAGNASCYFQYIMDVINYYCKKGQKQQARLFVKEHLIWFVNYVDNGEWGYKYPDFYSAKVKQRLTKYINEY